MEPDWAASLYWKTLPIIIVTKLAVFFWVGNFFGWWRYVTFADVVLLVKASTLATISWVSIDYFVIPGQQVPRAVMLIDWLLTIQGVGALRASVRLSREHFLPMVGNQKFDNALFVGTGTYDAALAARIHSDCQIPFRIVGFVDVEGRHQESRIGGIPVLGSVDNLPRLAKQSLVRHVLMCAGHLPHETIRDLVATCSECDLTVKVIPALDEWINSSKIDVRDLDIKDLLRRAPVQLHLETIENWLSGKTILVTGAGGKQSLQIHGGRKTDDPGNWRCN